MSPPSSPVAVASPCFDVATVHGSRGGVATVTLPPSIDASGGVCTVAVPDGWRGGQIAVTALGRRFHTDVIARTSGLVSCCGRPCPGFAAGE